MYLNPGTNGSDKQELTPLEVILKKTAEAKDLAAEIAEKVPKTKRQKNNNSFACKGHRLRKPSMLRLHRHLLLRPKVKMNSKFALFVEPRSASFNVFPPKKWSVSLSDFLPKKWLNLHQKKGANIKDRLISCTICSNCKRKRMLLARLHCARASTTTTAQVSVGE